MRMLKAAVATLLTTGCMLVGASGLSGAASPSKTLKITDVTMTAAGRSGYSAVTMTLTDGTSLPVSLTSVTSSVSRMSMIYYDDNMCQGNSKMTWLANILISPGYVQKLGYRYQGAMLGNLRTAVHVGETVPVKIAWSDFAKYQDVTVMAKVVAPPKGLHFLLSPMKM